MRRRPIHPEKVDDHSHVIRWVTDTGALPVGEVTSAPGTLGPLLEYGVLDRVHIEAGAVVTWVRQDLDLTEHGPRIRDAISLALGLDGWDVETPADS